MPGFLLLFFATHASGEHSLMLSFLGMVCVFQSSARQLLQGMQNTISWQIRVWQVRWHWQKRKLTLTAAKLDLCTKKDFCPINPTVKYFYL